jgi:hypothetical protein
MSEEHKIANCMISDIHIGFHEQAGIGLWWNMDIRKDQPHENPVKADMRFIEEILKLFNVDRLDDLQQELCKVEYSYSPSFHIHKLIKGKRSFDIDKYQKDTIQYLKEWLKDMEDDA